MDDFARIFIAQDGPVNSSPVFNGCDQQLLTIRCCNLSRKDRHGVFGLKREKFLDNFFLII